MTLAKDNQSDKFDATFSFRKISEEKHPQIANFQFAGHIYWRYLRCRDETGSLVGIFCVQSPSGRPVSVTHGVLGQSCNRMDSWQRPHLCEIAAEPEWAVCQFVIDPPHHDCRAHRYSLRWLSAA